MDPIHQAFEDRLQEIDVYLDLLSALDRQVAAGKPPQIGGETITAQQQRILYSSVYLQLYNLVEATANWCVKAVTSAAAENGQWRPGDLSASLRKEWVRHAARTHVELNTDNRLAAAVDFCDRLIQALPISEWDIEKGGGGNWDDLALEDIANRIGFPLSVSAEARLAVKKHVREDRGALSLVKYLRNQLAHGLISFSECGDGITVSDLREIKERSALYLREVVRVFRDYVSGYHFIAPDRRPVAEYVI